MGFFVNVYFCVFPWCKGPRAASSNEFGFLLESGLTVLMKMTWCLRVPFLGLLSLTKFFVDFPPC